MKRKMLQISFSICSFTAYHLDAIQMSNIICFSFIFWVIQTWTMNIVSHEPTSHCTIINILWQIQIFCSVLVCFSLSVRNKVQCIFTVTALWSEVVENVTSSWICVRYVRIECNFLFCFVLLCCWFESNSIIIIRELQPLCHLICLVDFETNQFWWIIPLQMLRL